MDTELVYFAVKPAEEIGKELNDKVKDFYRFIDSNGMVARQRKSYRTYYGFKGDNGPGESWRLNRGGESAELTYLRINHFRNLGQHLLNLTTSQKPSMQPIASNSDYRSQTQTSLARGLLDYYSREKRLDKLIKNATEMAIVVGEGYIAVEWDQKLGKDIGVDPETQEVLKDGDIRYTVFGPNDIIRDPYKDTPEDPDWIIHRRFVNKWELAARYPELAETIIGLECVKWDDTRLVIGQRTDKKEDVPVFTFYHKPSDAVPGGKYIIFLETDDVLAYGDLPYKTIPVVRIAPSDLMGTTQGYTPMYDLLGIQDIIDELYSIVITNQRTFGVQNIMVMKGHSLTVSELAGGLNLIEYADPNGKPESLNLTQTPAEIFNFIAKLEEVMETLSGINSTVRGNPEASLKSGSALALVQSQAIQFSIGLQHSYASCVEEVGTMTIRVLKDFVETPKIAMIVGKHNSYMIQEFKGEDLDQIDRVLVDSGSALSKTLSGKMQIAQDLLGAGMLTNPEEYLQLVLQGNIDPLIEGDQAELMLIRQENELMASGTPQPVIATDAHALHIKEHKCGISSPASRANPQIVETYLAHIQGHIEALMTVDPNLLAMLGQQSLMMPPGAMSPEQAGGGTPEAPGEPGNDGVAAMPGMPTNPATEQEWDPQTGGGVTSE